MLIEADNSFLEAHAQANLNVAPRQPRSGLNKAAWFVGVGLTAASIAGVDTYYAMNNKGEMANLAREILGFEHTNRIEQGYLNLIDHKNRMLHQIGRGPDEQPFDTPVQIITQRREEDFMMEPFQPPSSTNTLTEMAIAEPFPLQELQPKKIKPFILPETQLLLSDPMPGEGSWSIDGLPTTEEELTMAKTNIRLDASRPYANVGVIVFDTRRVNLNMVGGATDRRNGGDKGPGKVPSQDYPNLLAIMNGGFQFDHARQGFNTSAPFVWGAYLDGVEYATLQPGMGSIAVFKDGSIKIGVWGEGDLTQRTDDMIAVRQNGPLMIQDGELTSAIQNQGDVFMWGKFDKNSVGTVRTTRSAIGMTKDGNLMIAAGNDTSALNFARGLQAAGAHTAFQLDINSNWVELGVVNDHKADGSPILSTFKKEINNGSKFLSPQARDFMYITRSDDSRYKPD